MDFYNLVVNNPDWAYLFLLVGLLGVLFELTTPGTTFPGIVGTISLILSIYLFTNYQVNYYGLGLIILGFILLVLEIKFITFGALAVLGVTAFAFGSYNLIAGGGNEMTISTNMIITSSIVLLLFSVLLIYLGLKAQKNKKTTGIESLIGSCAIVSKEIFPNSIGEVKVLGERWRAKSQQHCRLDEEVVIEKIDNLTLFVNKK